MTILKCDNLKCKFVTGSNVLFSRHVLTHTKEDFFIIAETFLVKINAGVRSYFYIMYYFDLLHTITYGLDRIGIKLGCTLTFYIWSKKLPKFAIVKAGK